jgi:hypothetical protein
MSTFFASAFIGIYGFLFFSLPSAVAPRGVGVTLRVPVGYSCREPALTLTGGPTCAWACGINEWCTCVWGTCRFFFLLHYYLPSICTADIRKIRKYILPPYQNMLRIIFLKVSLTKFDQVYIKNIYIYNIKCI